MKRYNHLILLLLVLLIGILSRTLPFEIALLNKYLGDALYAVAFYLLFRVLWNQSTPKFAAFVTLLFVLAVEFFQLTLLPQSWRSSPNFTLKVLSIIVGTAFSWWDIVAYIAGISVIYWYDSTILSSK